jgi:SHS family lactate transporter-like MFS transporter
MISSPAAQILSTTAEKRLVFYKGKFRPDYARSQWGMMSAIFLLLAFWLSIGHEELGSRFELVARAGHEAYEEGGLAGEKKDALDSEEAGESEKSSMDKTPDAQTTEKK